MEINGKEWDVCINTNQRMWNVYIYIEDETAAPPVCNPLGDIERICRRCGGWWRCLSWRLNVPEIGTK